MEKGNDVVSVLSATSVSSTVFISKKYFYSCKFFFLMEAETCFATWW